MEQTHKYHIPLTGAGIGSGVLTAGRATVAPNFEAARALASPYAQQQAQQWNPNAPPPPIVQSELQDIIHGLGELSTRVMSHAIRAGNIADRLMGHNPRLTDPKPPMPVTHELPKLELLRQALSDLREHVANLDHNVERLERL